MAGTPDLDALYDGSYRRLVVQLYAICGDLADAEDAVEESFVTALRKRRDFDSVANPEAWLRTVALNHLRGGWRHASVVRRYQPRVPGPQGRRKAMSDLDVLRRLGEQVVPPPLDSLRDTARRRDRRGAVATVIASGAVLAVISTGAVLLGAGDRDAAPGPVDAPGGTGSTSHPLTHADGSTIHYGERTIPTDGVVVELDLTDHGVGFRTRDGRIWFGDGSATEHVVVPDWG